MKKVILITLIVLITFGCKIETTPVDVTNIIPLNEITNENYTEGIKGNFGFTLSLPKDWILKNIECPNDETNLFITIEMGTTSSGYTLGTAIYDETKALDKKNNLNISGNTMLNYQDARLTDDYMFSAIWYYYYTLPSNNKTYNNRIDYEVNGTSLNIKLLRF